MIKLSESAMGISNDNVLFIEGNFTECNGEYYFVYESEHLDDNTEAHKCISVGVADNSLVEFVKVLAPANLSFENSLDVIVMELDNEQSGLQMLDSMFLYLSYARDTEEVSFTEAIVDFIKPHLAEAEMYGYSEKSLLVCDFLRLFRLQGELICNNSTLMLKDVKLINISTNQVIQSYEAVKYFGQLYIDEDDYSSDVISNIEAFGESLSSHDIVKVFSEITRLF